ncbi:M13 family metallopeptidase [Hyphobacterium sp.]|uniref:M13 family metallopeptidase n=1 Tax=Hyphobacterium sp. TaxID=2004662 RepID=UPI00374A5410
MTVFEDLRDSSVNLLRVYQSGLTLRNRAYYLRQGERFDAYRAAYLDYIRTLFALAERPVPDDAADRILAFETRLAEVHWTREQSRDVQATYNVMSVEELDRLAPAFDFPGVFSSHGVEVDRLILVHPSAISASSQIFSETGLETLRLWMSFRVLSNRADWMSDRFDAAKFDFFGRTLAGLDQRRDRTSRGVDLVSRALGDSIGQVYVERYFPADAESRMQEMVDQIMSTYAERLAGAGWMDEPTRTEALAKVNTLSSRIGYPEIWDEYEGLMLRPDDYFGNRERLAEYIWSRNVEALTQGGDPREWNRAPQSVDASYNVVQNQITFPAGILQPPFFDRNADPAVSFGAIGAIIAHEITHGFDDQGRRYDSAGSLRDWWTAETEQRFSERAARLGAQFATYCPIDDLCVNPDASMGENIADLGGLEIAYAAWRAYVREHHDGQAPTIDGFTGDQRFFLGWAQIWRNLYTEDALRAQLVEGPHAPPRYRINGVVRNMEAWYTAFDVSADDALYLPADERVSFWGVD